MRPRSPMIAGALAILCGSLNEFEDPQVRVIFLSSGAIFLASGVFLFVASMHNPKSRLGIWFLSIQLLGTVVLIELAWRVDSMYLIGVAGVLAVALLTIGVVRGEIELRRNP